jgi:hypothetical protein
MIQTLRDQLSFDVPVTVLKMQIQEALGSSRIYHAHLEKNQAEIFKNPTLTETQLKQIQQSAELIEILHILNSHETSEPALQKLKLNTQNWLRLMGYLCVKEIEQYQELLNQILKAQHKGTIIPSENENQSNHVVINYSPDKAKILIVHLQRLPKTHARLMIILPEGVETINGIEGINYIRRKQIQTESLINIEKLQGKLGKIDAIYTTE